MRTNPGPWQYVRAFAPPYLRNCAAMALTGVDTVERQRESIGGQDHGVNGHFVTSMAATIRAMDSPPRCLDSI